MSYIIDGKKLVSYVDDDQLDVVVPKGIETIGREAFEGSNVRSVSLPDSVKIIDYYAFSSCKDLHYIHLGCNVEHIMDSAFEGCQNLRTINIPDSVKEIGYNALKDCLSLETVSFVSESSMETICSGAFKGCRCLKHIELPDSISYIGKECFKGCKNLTGTIVIPEKCRIVDKETFSECLRINAVVLPPSLKGIGAFAFFGCRGLSSITIPGSAETIGFGAFEDCKELKTADIKKGVNYISDFAFSDCISLECLIIADSVIKIGKLAFSYCEKLSELIIPHGVERIDDGAFEKCIHLKSVALPDSIIQIGMHAFCDCINLMNMRLPKGLTRFGQGAFDGTAWLEVQRNENPMVIINDIIIDGKTCSGDIIIGGVSRIADRAFQGSKIKSISFLSGVQFIGNRSFDGCKSLKRITFPDSIIEIGSGAFKNCGLEVVSIPDNLVVNIFKRQNDYLKDITYEAWFDGNSMLTNIEITHRENEKIRYDSIDGAVYELDDNGQPTALIICPPGKSELYIPNGVTSITENAFFSCEFMACLHLPLTLKFENTKWYERLPPLTYNTPEYITNTALYKVLKTLSFKSAHEKEFNSRTFEEYEMHPVTKEVTFYCSRESEAYQFAKDNHINVVIEENSSDNNTEN